MEGGQVRCMEGVRGGGGEEGAEVTLERWRRRMRKEGGGGSLSLTLIPSNLIFSAV